MKGKTCPKHNFNACDSTVKPQFTATYLPQTSIDCSHILSPKLCLTCSSQF